MKRCLSVLLSALLLLSLWIVPAQAAGGKLIAITYDDGPGRYTDQLLDGLKARGAKATFFVLGDSASFRPDTVARAFQEGHQIANHSYSHPELTGMSAAGIQDQLKRVNALLDSICGQGGQYSVRAPFGSVNSTVKQNAGAPLIHWNVDPLDWKYRDAQRVKSQLVSGAKDGGILLVHDLYATTVEGSLAAIDALKAQGYEFVTVRELFRRRGVALENGKQYFSCPATGKDLGPVAPPSIAAVPEGKQYRVTLTAQAGVPVFYTTDGSPVKQDSPRYSGPFLVSAPSKVQAAAAYALNGSRSETVFREFTQPQTQPPVLSLTEGQLSFSCPTPGASVYFTLTGEHAAPERIYDGVPFALSPGTAVTAYAKAPDYLPSTPVTACYTPLENLFYDVPPDAWYLEAADALCAQGIMSGTAAGYFSPDAPLTRGQLVTALFRSSGDAASGGLSPFRDVPQGAYYADAVLWAYQKGIAGGYQDGTFRPQKNVTRQEMALFVQRYLNGKEAPLLRADLSGYPDAASIAPWAREAVGALTACKLLTGSGSAFRPDAPAARAQAAALLYRAQGYIAASHLPPPRSGPDAAATMPPLDLPSRGG